MTHSGGKSHLIGDLGQRYAVTYYDRGEKCRRALGWTESHDTAEAMVRAIDKHPSWCDPKIIDREASNVPGPE